MAQGDYLIQNQSFPSFRSDLNSTLEAINTSNSGTSRPSSAVAGTVWLDTTNATNPTLKFFDGTDDISLAQLDYSANTVNWLDSSVVADLVNDTTPQLGGDLDVNGNSIVSVSNGNITFTPDGTGKVIIDGLSYPTADGTTGQFLKTDGSGNLSFDDAGLNGWSEDGANNNLLPASASAGIYLGVNSATASNLLDDYEEGTWTPTFTSGGNTLTITGGTQTYRYTKIGRQVFIEFNIENSTVSGTTATGDNRITLPFTNGSSAGRIPVSIVSFFLSGGLRYTGADVLYGEIGRNSSFIQLAEWVNGSTYRNISVAPTTGSGTYFWFCATYTVD